MTVKPISPDEILDARQAIIPDEVITVFNEMIVENWKGSYAHVDQDEVVNRIAVRMNVERQVIFDKGWIDVEPIFRNVGWKVEYDKPAYCESYAAYFEFSK